MTVKTGQAWAGLFVTLDATGALAAGTPSGVLYVDGVANAATVTITGTNPYKWVVTLPSLTAGQRVDMYITATIATIATAGIVASEQADTAILSDGVVVNSGTVTTLTNLPAVTTDWLTAAGVKADAVTKLQTGLALEATLTAIKGAGWTTETLAAIDVLIDAIKAKSDLIPASPAQAGEYTAAIAAIPTTPLLAANYTAPDNASITGIKAKTDNLPANTTTTLAAIQADLDNPAQYKADVSGLATSAEVGAIALLGETVVGTYTVQDILKILASKMVGKATGGGTATITYRGVDDTSNVVVETVDDNGNCSAVTLTV